MRPPGGDTMEATGAPRRRNPRRGAYLLPSLFTIGSMSLGFYAVVLGLDKRFELAALLVFIAGIADSLDGRIARLTGTESEFGKEYDSLADVITFGAVPALLTYFWGLRELHRDAWLCCLFYMVCTATRLARFNVQTKIVDSRWFVGLPAPAAAGAVCSLLFFASWVDEAPWAEEHGRLVMQLAVAGALLVIGVLMVSTFRYKSFKTIDLSRRRSYRAAIALAAVLLVVIYIPKATFLAIAVLYTLSAPIAALWHRLTRRSPPEPEPAA